MSHHQSPISRVRRSRKDARRTYDRLSRWYDLLSGGYERKHREAAVHKFAPSAGETVLEIGCGTGHAMLALAELVGESGRVFGIDISEGMLAVARARVAQAGVARRVGLMQGDALHLPYGSGCFDGIFTSFTLELFDTPEIPRVLAECRRTLRGGGRLCVLAMSKKGKSNAMTLLYERLHEMLPQYLDCRPIYAREAFEAAGFCILDTTSRSMAGLQVELVLGEKDL